MRLLFSLVLAAGVLCAEVKLGKPLELKEPVTVSALNAKASDLLEKTVQVKGKVTEVCQMMGCWMALAEPGTTQTIRIKVNDGEIVFPMTCLGKEVQVEGVMEKMVIPVETLREALAKQAEKKGEKFDPASVKEPRIVWQLKGLGAKFETK